MKRSVMTVVAAATTMALALTGCGGGNAQPQAGGTAAASSGEISLAGWSLATTPEFKLLADGFNATNPKQKVVLKEYDATNYDTQMTADLAAGTAPDVYVQKNLKNFVTYQAGEQLQDVSDIAKDLSSVDSVKAYTVDGKTYAIPYRQDAWFLYYNKDLFKQAGVAEPTGSWTWDDYAKAAAELTTKLKEKGSDAKGAYQHNWQSTVQGFATAQTQGADILKGDFSHFKPFYERSLAMQKAGSMVDYGSVTTNKLTYQSQFGTQKSAMMLMGSWYVATLIAQQAKGDAQSFQWGIAPVPQVTAGATPVTFGDPTGLGINPAISKDKLDTAKAFLKYVASKDASKALAGIGISPAQVNDEISSTYFSVKGAPTDDLSKKTFSNREVKPENPVSEKTAPLQNILNDMHSAIMSGSEPVDAAITKAQDRAKNEVKG